MALSRSQKACVTLESIESSLPEGVEVFHERGTGRMVFPMISKEGHFMVALLYRKPADSNRPTRLEGGTFPSPNEGIVTDPDGWKFRTVRLNENDALGQMKELLEAVKEFAAA